MKLIPVAPFVRLTHTRFSEPAAFFTAIAAECARPECDYLDGVWFGPEDFVLTRAHFAERPPAGVREPSDYTWMRQYWQSLRAVREDWLTIHDYLWRWDTDWFWCSRNVGAHLAPVRLVLGRRGLSSVTYQKIMRAAQRWPLKALAALRGPRESLIQDVDIPIDSAADFLADLHTQVGIRPVWACPFVVGSAAFPLYRLRTSTPYVNFGFWDTLPVRGPGQELHYNATVERLVAAHGGKKSLYSRSTYDEPGFWSIYDREAYLALKRRYDPDGRFPGLYEKAVGRA
jgi:FAD/FMN-containing dehydrogenase